MQFHRLLCSSRPHWVVLGQDQGSTSCPSRSPPPRPDHRRPTSLMLARSLLYPRPRPDFPSSSPDLEQGGYLVWTFTTTTFSGYEIAMECIDLGKLLLIYT
ncbi:hypothetical protein ZIOFF_019113 [Zingiber officinale]|uniref:Uncharacterized protein n=1 Tax=Zingiber officinale TaxID=94328 RepID=A0A8J5H729_ZINOF|nr:hypothetical protein ZIOFF_019113 [Zingiber officinale]